MIRSTRKLVERQWRLILLSMVAAAVILAIWLTPVHHYFSEQGLNTLMENLRDVWWSPLVVMGLILIATPVGIPTTPLLLGGAAYGVWAGSFYNTVGLILGAVLSYELARGLGRNFVLAVTGDNIRTIERRFHRVAFWPLVHTCFTPIPFPVINYGAALAGVRRGLFLSAITVGLIPSTVLHTYFMSALIEADWDRRGVVLAAYIGAFLLFNVVAGYPWVSRQMKRRSNYQKILSSRARRNVDTTVEICETPWT